MANRQASKQTHSRSRTIGVCIGRQLGFTPIGFKALGFSRGMAWWSSRISEVPAKQTKYDREDHGPPRGRRF
eukprot:1640528-Amphidinium_carterae.1